MDPLLQGFYTLGSPQNKVNDLNESNDSIVSELLPELELSMTDDELIGLKRDWIRAWEPYNKEILRKQEDNEKYWMGSHFNPGEEKRPAIDNLIFESLETFLPIASRPKLDPMVESDNSDIGNQIADKVRKMLGFLSDTLTFNLKMKQVVRYWALYLLGVMKVGWSMKENDITCQAIRPQKLILDPKATINECEYDGYYIGEYLEDMASDLILRFPKKAQFITDKVKNKMGTTLQYILWTTDEYVFWTLEDEVLAKNKNPHWNYETTQSQTDDMGTQSHSVTPGKNHFKNKKKPYIFLSFFNLGKHPHDDTNLIQQNIPLQDMVNKRLMQMDKNADNANGGLALSGDAFTEEQAAKAAKAKRKGGVIWVPTGPIANAVANLPGEQLPNFIYQALIDYRSELRNIFGIRGSSPQGLSGERTVRGKMFMQQQDQSRIGGGLSSMLEEFADVTLNWFVQLMYVYYDEPHVATILGDANAKEYVELSNKDLTSQLLIGVKEGSMIPSDPESKRQEAMQLWAEKAIDPITFFSRLDFPNPKESAKNLYLWLSDPVQLFPDLAQAQAQNKQPEDKPHVTINYKDVEDPSAKAQLLSEAGIHVEPTALAVSGMKNKIQEHQLETATTHISHTHQIGQKAFDGLVKSHLQTVKPKVSNKK